MVLMGLLMLTGKMNDITGYLSSIGQQTAQDSEKEDSSVDKDGAGSTAAGEESAESSEEGTEEQTEEQDGEKVRAYMTGLKDQYGNTHNLDDYKGKVVFLNFWATWCGPCRNEMPEIQKLYEEYAQKGEEAEVVILGVAGPGVGQEGTVSEITDFMKENGYTYPVLMDETGEMFEWYGISAFPTTYMIDRDGNLYGYVTGQLTEDIMRSIIDQTLEGKVP